MVIKNYRLSIGVKLSGSDYVASFANLTDKTDLGVVCFPESLGYVILECLKKVEWPAIIEINSEVGPEEFCTLAEARIERE